MKKLRYALLIVVIVVTLLMSTLSAFAWPPQGDGNGPTGGEPPGWSGTTPGNGSSGSGGHTGQPPYGK